MDTLPEQFLVKNVLKTIADLLRVLITVFVLKRSVGITFSFREFGSFCLSTFHHTSGFTHQTQYAFSRLDEELNSPY